jgi:hypothetical protein
VKQFNIYLNEDIPYKANIASVLRVNYFIWGGRGSPETLAEKIDVVCCILIPSPPCLRCEPDQTGPRQHLFIPHGRYIHAAW